jgi:hypothetical protein
VWNLTSAQGEFDISFVPSGTDGYEDLARHARIIDVDGNSIPVADLDDIIRSKEAARRPKDILHLPILIQTARRQRGRREIRAPDEDLDFGS